MRAAQIPGRQSGHCGRGHVGAQLVDGLAGGPLGADLQRLRGHRLGQIGGKQQVRRRQLAEPEVDDPNVVVVVEEHVGEAQVPMGDAVGPQGADLLPYLADHGVGQLARLDPVQRAPGDALIGQHEAVGFRGGDAEQTWGTHAKLAGHEGHHGLVLDGPTQRRKRSLVSQLPRQYGAVDAEQEVGAALVAPEGLDKKGVAMTISTEIRRRPTGVDAGWLQRGHIDSHPAQPGDHRFPRCPAQRAPHEHQRRRPRRPPDQDGQQALTRDGLGHEPGQDQPRDHGPRQPALPATQPRGGGCHSAGQCGNARARRKAALGQRSSPVAQPYQRGIVPCAPSRSEASRPGRPAPRPRAARRAASTGPAGP